MARTRTAAPTQKIGAAGVAGLITTIVLFLLQRYAHTDIPGEVAAAITGLIAFVIGYIVPPGDDEVVVTPTPSSVEVTTDVVNVNEVGE